MFGDELLELDEVSLLLNASGTHFEFWLCKLAFKVGLRKQNL